MTGKLSSSTLSFFFRLPTNSLTKALKSTVVRIHRYSRHPKKKIDPDVIVHGHGAKKEKQISSGTLFFLLVNRSIFRKGAQTNCIYRSSWSIKKQFDSEVTCQGERSKNEENGAWVPTLPFF